MKYQAKTALGVDVNQTQACVALVRKERKRIVVVRTARAPLPAGLIEDGRITDPAALTRILADLKSRCKGRPELVGVSLSGPWVRIQILELPNPLPTNVPAFVQSEIKQMVPLAPDQIISDYCNLASKGPHRLLAVAADGACTLPLVEACERIWPRVETVEPSLVAAIRGLHAKAISGQPDCSVLLAVLHSTTLELCVFQAGQLDFIRTRDMSEVQSDPQAQAQRLAKEITAVVRYYGVEVAETPGRWKIMVLRDDMTVLSDQVGLQSTLGDVTLLTSEHMASALGAECADPAILAETSPTAVGLAMRLLGRDEDTPPFNLLPFQIVQKRVAIRHGLIAAVCGAVVLLIMGLSALGLRSRSTALSDTLSDRKVAAGFAQTVALVTTQRKLVSRIEQLSKGQSRLDEVLKVQSEVDWPGLLDDIRNVRPQGLRVRRLSSVESEKPEMLIDGWSLNYGAINQFVSKLNQSDRIASASVVKSGQEEINGSMYFVYQVRCALEVKVGI